MKIQGPIEVELRVSVTNGEAVQPARATLSKLLCVTLRCL